MKLFRYLKEEALVVKYYGEYLPESKYKKKKSKTNLEYLKSNARDPVSPEKKYRSSSTPEIQ